MRIERSPLRRAKKRDRIEKTELIMQHSGDQNVLKVHVMGVFFFFIFLFFHFFYDLFYFLFYFFIFPNRFFVAGFFFNLFFIFFIFLNLFLEKK